MSLRKRHVPPDGILDLTSAIPGQSRNKLFHLLTCSRCRTAALELCTREFPGDTAPPQEKRPWKWLRKGHLTPIEVDRAGAGALLAELLESPDPVSPSVRLRRLSRRFLRLSTSRIPRIWSRPP